MKRSHFLTILGVVLASSGCGEAQAQPAGVRMDITVRNTTPQNIYVVVNSGARHEDFGVVGAGFGKTIGFGVTPVGHTLTLDWSVGDPGGAKRTVTLALPAPVNDEVTLTYQGEGKWTTVPSAPPNP
jgi:hypothetical protein